MYISTHFLSEITIDLKDLRELDFSSKQLKEIKANTFIGQDNLQVLSLKENKMTKEKKKPLLALII